MKKRLLICCFVAISYSVFAQDWPNISTESRPGSRWWWLGSAVDKENLTYNLEEYAKAGLGAMEITPIYGVQGNDKNNIPYLTSQWMDILKHTQAEGKRLGIQIDMNMGTGWPFGGPSVSIADAATKAIFQTYKTEGGQKITLDIQVQDQKQVPHAILSRVMAYSDKGSSLNLTSKAKNGKLDWQVPSGK